MRALTLIVGLLLMTPVLAADITSDELTESLSTIGLFATRCPDVKPEDKASLVRLFNTYAKAVDEKALRLAALNTGAKAEAAGLKKFCDGMRPVMEKTAADFARK